MRRLPSLTIVALVVLSAGCGDGGGDPTNAYCDRLIAEQEQLIAQLGTSDDIINQIARYQSFADQAPLDIDQQWQQVTDLISRASTVDLNDPVAKQAIVTEAYAAEQSAREIAAHASESCSLDTLQLIIPPPLTAPPPVPATEG